MSDWQKGDLSEKVFSGSFTCRHGMKHNGNLNSARRFQTVIGIKPVHNIAGIECGCAALILSDGSVGHEARFRKVTPPKATLEDHGIIALMNKEPNHVD